MSEFNEPFDPAVLNRKPRDDGGPAFPDHNLPHRHNGMSLRDYFAAHALTMVADATALAVIDEIAIRRGVEATTVVAKYAYELADAMLKARKL